MARYQGEEVKFAVTLEAQGFDMDTDDWELEVVSGRTSYHISKADCEKDEQSTTVTNPDTNEEETVTTTTWYAIADTSELAVGEMRVIGKCYVPDAAAKDGVRTEICRTKLDTLEKA